jgi:hypothetical protein
MVPQSQSSGIYPVKLHLRADSTVSRKQGITRSPLICGPSRHQSNSIYPRKSVDRPTEEELNFQVGIAYIWLESTLLPNILQKSTKMAMMDPTKLKPLLQGPLEATGLFHQGANSCTCTQDFCACVHCPKTQESFT